MASRMRGARGRRTRSAVAAVTLAGGLLLTGCGGDGAATPAPTASGSPAAEASSASSPTQTSSASSPTATSSGSPSAGSSSANTLTIPITMTGDSVTPNAEKIDATVGQRVVLQVTSDIADEVHAHTGGDGYSLEVPAGEPTTGSFTLDTPGSFEVESHHREKVLLILNVR